jgi:hypothetical protein
MNTNKKNTGNTKRPYKKPAIQRVDVDNEISMVMMSPPGDPVEFSLKPLKFMK